MKHLSKRYEKKSALAVNDLNLQIKDGIIFGFLGPNGAGKSTTLSLLNGSLKPTTGSVSINGFDLQKNPLAVKKMIGYVPDNPLLYEHMSGRAYINFVCDLFEVSHKERNQGLDKMATLFGLDAVLDQKIRSYSHGMKQKVCIISALIHHPQILILDEPMVGLDPKSSFILKDLMRRFAKNGGTVFFSTHVMEVAENLCDEIGIIKKGNLLFAGSFEALQKGRSEKLEQIFLSLTGEDDIENEVEKSLW